MNIEQIAERLGVPLVSWTVAAVSKLISEAVESNRLALITDYEEVLADKRRLTRELDILLNGAGAARQARLCDIVAQVAKERIRSRLYIDLEQPK